VSREADEFHNFIHSLSKSGGKVEFKGKRISPRPKDAPTGGKGAARKTTRRRTKG